VHSPKDVRAGQHHVGDGYRQQEFPAEVHQLVIAEARECAAHPDVEKQHREDLRKKPKWALNHLVHRRSQEKPPANQGQNESDSRKEDTTEDGFVAEAVEN